EAEVGIAGFLYGGAPQAADHFLPVTAIGIPEHARVHADLAEDVLMGQAIGIQSTCDGEYPARMSGFHAKPPHRTAGPAFRGTLLYLSSGQVPVNKTQGKFPCQMTICTPARHFMA